MVGKHGDTHERGSPIPPSLLPYIVEGEEAAAQNILQEALQDNMEECRGPDQILEMSLVRPDSVRTSPACGDQPLVAELNEDHPRADEPLALTPLADRVRTTREEKRLSMAMRRRL